MNWIPLFSGNASENASMGVALFRNDVTMDKVQKRFISYANGRAIECPVYNCNDKLTFNLLFIPIPYLFTYNEISISGTMK